MYVLKGPPIVMYKYDRTCTAISVQIADTQKEQVYRKPRVFIQNMTRQMDARLHYRSMKTGLFQKGYTLTPPPAPRPENRLLAKAELRPSISWTIKIKDTTHNREPVPRMFESRALSRADAERLASARHQCETIHKEHIKQYKPLMSLKLEAEEPWLLP